jgi:hypothetical protein
VLLNNALRPFVEIHRGTSATAAVTITLGTFLAPLSFISISTAIVATRPAARESATTPAKATASKLAATLTAAAAETATAITEAAKPTLAALFTVVAPAALLAIFLPLGLRKFGQRTGVKNCRANNGQEQDGR